MVQPAASIIVPVYQAEKYFHRCLDSIATQTYSDFEVIIIDDGSTDASGNICEEYARNDKRFHVYHQANQGVAKARRAGLAHAHGRYIFWVDADDYVSTSFLKKALSDANNADLIIWDTDTITSKGKVIKSNRWKDMTINEWRRMATLGHLSTLWTNAGKKSVWDSVSFPPHITYAGEDGYLALALVRKATSVHVVHEALYFHVDDTQGSISHRKTARYYYDNFQLWKYRYEICKDQYPEQADFCGQRALSAAVKAYCINRTTKVLAAADCQYVMKWLDFLSSHPISGRYKEKILSWAIRHHYDSICDLYIRHKL